MIELLEWMGALCALGGAYYIMKRNRFGFYLFSVYNLLWIIMSLSTAQYGITALMCAYMFINIKGLSTWK